MSRYTGPKARICRREGVNIFGSEKYQKILQNRPGTPGQHGISLRRKQTQYGKQLREKQKTRFMFGITEKQMRNYYKKATAMSGDTGEQLISLVEKRYDNALYRAGFVNTRMQARQLITHGHVLLNGSKANKPGIQLKAGDVIEIKPNTKKNPMFQNLSDKYMAPKWLKVDRSNLQVTIEDEPTTDDFEQIIEPRLIVEFYSR